MASALVIDAAEQVPHLRAPSHHRELVHGRDHHRRRAVIDFLVDDLHGKPRVRLAAGFRLREIATTELVPAVDQRPAGDPVDLTMSRPP